MSEFSVKFRGVRGSFPVAKKEFYNYGGNTSCVEVNAGGHLIILDAGTGIVDVGDDLMEKSISTSVKPEERKPIMATVLLSHIHHDHLLGLTFFKPLHLKSTKVMVFGPEQVNTTLADSLSEIIFGKTFPLDLDEISCRLEIQGICDGQAILIKKDKNKSFC